MHGSYWPFSLILLTVLAYPHPLWAQRPNRLAGRWVASVPAQENAFIVSNDDTIHFQGRPAYNVTLNLKANNQGFIRWGDSAKAVFFVYQTINSKLIKMAFANKQARQHTFTIRGQKLYLGEYPIPKEPQETIDMLYALTFVKQR